VSSPAETGASTDSEKRDSPEAPGLPQLLTDWGAAYGQRFATGAKVVMAETRLAVTSFVLMVFGVMIAAGLAMFAWGLLLFAGMRAFTLVGMPLIATAIVLALLHLLAAFLIWRGVSRLSHRFEFEATREIFGDPE